jgi:signal transduction histidine kinase
MNSALLFLKRIACLWLACHLLTSAVGAQTSTVQTAPTVIDQAQALITVQGSAELSLVALPYHWDRMHQGVPGQASFEVAFALPGTPTEPYAALLPRVGNRFEVWINGNLLSKSGSLSSQGDADYAKAPRFVPIAPQLLQANNLLRIQLETDGGRRGGLSAVTIGTEHAVRALYDQAYRGRVAGSMAVLMVMLLTALVSAALWFTQLDHAKTSPVTHQQPAAQRDRMYGFAALASLCWALRLTDTLIENPPLPWPAWGVLMALALTGAALLVVMFSIYVAQWQQHRWAKAYAWSIPLWLALCAGAATYGLTRYQPAALTAWFTLTTSVGAVFTVGYAIAAVRSAIPAHRWMAAAMVVNLLFNIFDVWKYRLSHQLDTQPWSSYMSVLYGLVIFSIVVTRFRSASVQARELLLSLEQRVQDKEAALSASYQQLERLAREQERSAERTRILRDMHDGVGSHISAAIRQLQSGQASDGQVLMTLRDSLDQLKLSIDAIHLPAGDVNALLANLRYRLEPRFTSSGMVFEWDVDALPQIVQLDHGAMRQLQYMAFEALSNVLQHAQARTLRVEARAQGLGAVIRFIDDGKGFDAKHITSRGLASMRERATAIGAQLHLRSQAGRTEVEIILAEPS